MKKFKKIMAVLVAAMMIMATMVPAWAASGSGRLEDRTTGETPQPKGEITINSIKADETYTLWRMFELASFTDTNTDAGVHIDAAADPAQDEAYSYVIRKSSPWYTWLTTAHDGVTYAVEIAEGGDDTGALATGQLFWIEHDPITVDGITDYHVIYATNNFKNSADLPAGTNTNDKPTTDYLTGDAATIQKFAQAAVAWAEEQPFTGATADYAPVFNDVPSSAQLAAEKIVVQNLLLGYYLLGSSQGTLCSLDTTNLSVDIFEKNAMATLPENAKRVLSKEATKTFLASLEDDDDPETTTPTEDSIRNVTSGWVGNRDANIGDKIYFRTIITAQQGAENYILHDVMEKGFTFGEVLAITLKHTSGDAVLINNIQDISADTTPNNKTNWTVTKPGDTSPVEHKNSQDDFEIHFADERFYDSTKAEQVIKDGDTITVYYSATINNDAILYGSDADVAAKLSDVTTTKGTKIENLPDGTKVSQVRFESDGDGRNTNSTILTYGNNSVTSEWKKASVTVYQFDIIKTRQPQNASTTKKSLLEGAKFELYRATTSNNGGETYTYGSTGYHKDGAALKFLYNNATDANFYKYDGFSAGSGTTSTITSLNNEEVNLVGLEAGTYLLFETEAPIGFNRLAHPILITINGGNDVPSEVTNEGKISVIMIDNNGKLIPSAGSTTYAWHANVGTSSGGVKYYDKDEKYGEPLRDNGGLEIINKAGQELPSTGGMGTTVLYIVGGMLVVLAGAYLFFSKKRTA
jgi:LPXTG-motif cell wall-anchored protein